MAEETKVMSKTDLKTTLTYEDRVIRKIAGLATAEVPGIFAMSGGLMSNLSGMLQRTGDSTRGIAAEVGSHQVALDLNVVCEHGACIPSIFDIVVQKISESVKTMTGLDVVEINMHVADILLKADFDKQRAKQIEAAREEIIEKEPMSSRVE